MNLAKWARSELIEFRTSASVKRPNCIARSAPHLVIVPLSFSSTRIAGWIASHSHHWPSNMNMQQLIDTDFAGRRNLSNLTVIENRIHCDSIKYIQSRETSHWETWEWVKKVMRECADLGFGLQKHCEPLRDAVSLMDSRLRDKNKNKKITRTWCNDGWASGKSNSGKFWCCAHIGNGNCCAVVFLRRHQNENNFNISECDILILQEKWNVFVNFRLFAQPLNRTCRRLFYLLIHLVWIVFALSRQTTDSTIKFYASISGWKVKKTFYYQCVRN